tara:strand:+ start:28263 stop:29219 length:957 start_codon:yes stop_codon:yes gene_type:complete
MKVCLSQTTYNSFKSNFDNLFDENDLIIIDSSANIIKGQGKPEVVFISYEVMFKAQTDNKYFKKYLNVIHGCSFIQGSWAGIESKTAQILIEKTNFYSHGGGIHAIPIASYVFAHILRRAKSIDEHIELQKQKKWEPMTSIGELTDMTIGISGFGGIGKEVARLSKAFRMKVLATKRTHSSDINLDRLYKPESLEEMLVKSDYIVNCLPASSETIKTYSSPQFKEMKESAMFINVGRGETVDEPSLIKALKEGQIDSAVLDTTDPEPLSADSELWDLKNCFITPHDSAWGPRAPQRAVDLFVENYKRFKSGERLINQV